MENWQTLVKEREFNDLLIEWNKKINLVSRKKTDVTDLIEDSKIFFDAIDFKPGIKILDLGTGGGFPGIVIAIHYPETILTLVDSIQKKINVVTDLASKLGLTNVKVLCSRAEELSKDPQHHKQYDYVVARSVAVLQDLAKWSEHLIKPGGKLIAVKGSSIKGELNAAKKLKFIDSINVFPKEEKNLIAATFK